ncbi:MAG: thioredoxin family protein, partial [Pseudomonadota bacterium]
TLALIFVIPQNAAPVAADSGTNTAATLPNSASFLPERLADYRREQLPAFVYFTADWCITCKVNEAGALADADVIQAFSDVGVRTLVGDWTRADPVITAALEGYGRAGVPLYVYYAPGEEARILPQLLSSDALVRMVYEEEV